MQIQADELVAVQVPKRLLPQVYGLIAASYNDSREGVETGWVPDSERSFALPHDVDGRWKSEQLLTRCWKESPVSMRKVMKHLAQKPGTPAPITDVAAAVYGDGNLQSRRMLAGVLGAFGRRIKNRYSMPTWPFRADFNHLTNLWEYTMTPDIAAKVRNF